MSFYAKAGFGLLLTTAGIHWISWLLQGAEGKPSATYRGLPVFASK